MDAEQNGGRIIRLSPHIKGADEQSKYGFAFFPQSDILAEPWVGKASKRANVSAISCLYEEAEEAEILKQKTAQKEELASQYRPRPSSIVEDILQTGDSHLIYRSGLNGRSSYF